MPAKRAPAAPAAAGARTTGLHTCMAGRAAGLRACVNMGCLHEGAFLNQPQHDRISHYMRYPVNSPRQTPSIFRFSAPAVRQHADALTCNCSSSRLHCTYSHGRMPCKQQCQKCSAAHPPYGVTEWAWARLRLRGPGALDLERPLLHPLHRRVQLCGHIPGPRTKVTPSLRPEKCMGACSALSMPWSSARSAPCMPAPHVLHAELCKNQVGRKAPVPVSIATSEPGWSSTAQVSLSGAPVWHKVQATAAALVALARGRGYQKQRRIAGIAVDAGGQAALLRVTLTRTSQPKRLSARQMCLNMNICVWYLYTTPCWRGYIASTFRRTAWMGFIDHLRGTCQGSEILYIAAYIVKLQCHHSPQKLTPWRYCR